MPRLKMSCERQINRQERSRQNVTGKSWSQKPNVQDTAPVGSESAGGAKTLHLNVYNFPVGLPGHELLGEAGTLHGWLRGCEGKSMALGVLPQRRTGRKGPQHCQFGASIFDSDSICKSRKVNYKLWHILDAMGWRLIPLIEP
eukprot:scaffold214973_cov19-Tisochrysis_lutea.AAC.3